MITDVYETATEVVDHLARLHREVGETILKLSTGKEYLWPFSNPPRLWENEEIPVAQFEGEQREKTVYRNYLASKYGKRKMLFSGIHLNYSLPDPMLREEYKITTKQEDAVQVEESGYRIYKDQVYLQLAQQLTKYTWFIVYLTAASPVLDFSFCTYKDSGNDWVKEDLHKYASVRCGEKGYWNDFTPILEYADLESYIQSIEHYVESGQLKGASELYYPIRLKPRGVNSLDNIRKKGVNHIELRMLDVNPLSPVGILVEDIEFLHYFIQYLHHQPKIRLTREEQLKAIRNEKEAALFEDKNIIIQLEEEEPVREAVRKILNRMKAFYEMLDWEPALQLIRYQTEKIDLPDNRYADRIWNAYETDYMNKGIELSETFRNQLLGI